MSNNHTTPDVITEVRGQFGFITLNRPLALNALNLSMIRDLTTCLMVWQDDARVQAVAIRGSNKAGPFGAFCAGGDIRFFHQSLLTGDPSTEEFFTEEYTLNHLIHSYSKPYVAFMDGVVMGGGMGISQGASHRLVSPRTKMAMPETAIGLFPDVGGGYFLSRCPGHVGEWLALTGSSLGAFDAIAFGLADSCLDVAMQATLWDALGTLNDCKKEQISALIATFSVAGEASHTGVISQIDHYFSKDSVMAIVSALESNTTDWTQTTAAQLRQRSPLMLNVAFEQIRRARNLNITDDLMMERDLMRHCFFPRHMGRSGVQTDTAEGIRALVIDKDNTPKWQPQRIEDVTPEMVQRFFDSPWAPHCHPLRMLQLSAHQAAG
jgi:enoyl-CoA hydratase/carnithine racemase